MTMDFQKSDRVFRPDLNNLAQIGRRSVRIDCEVTEKGVPDMSVDVASGQVIFGASAVNVVGVNVAVAASDPSFDRIDLVVVNAAATVSVITGTTDIVNNKPKSPDYDVDTFVVLARVFVDDGVTSILNAAIFDLRIIPETIYGLSRFEQVFAAVATVSVNHNLNDAFPHVQVFDNSVPPQLIEPDAIELTDANNVDITFTGTESGTVVVFGGTGGTVSTGAGGSFRHTQGGAATTWNVNHALAEQYVVVQAFDASDVLIIPDTVTLTDANNLVLTFSVAVAGTAVVIK